MNPQIERARRLLRREEAWLCQEDNHYALRVGADRRSRVVLSIDEAGFHALVANPGLSPRATGGWCASRIPPVEATDIYVPPRSSEAAGRPGLILGLRDVVLPDGQLVRRLANLGESPIAWLARRKDAEGQPWLTPQEAAAGERLRQDMELAQSGASLTMRWDALPRAATRQGGSGYQGGAHSAALARIDAALKAVSASQRAMLLRICLYGDSLKLAESGLGLRRRTGKHTLKQALLSLSDHYSRR